MRSPAFRNRRLTKIGHTVIGSRLAVVRDDRGGVVEITEVEPAAADLAKVGVVRLFADAGSLRVALSGQALPGFQEARGPCTSWTSRSAVFIA